MPVKKKKKSEEKQTLGITAFLVEEEEKEKTSQKATTVEEKKIESKVENVEEISNRIVELLKKRGGLISKDELIAWAKARGIKISLIMKAIDELTKKKMIVRRIVDEKLCYELKV